MELYGLIASEFHHQPSFETPVFQLMHLAGLAEKRRNDRIKAAESGRQYVG